MSGCFTHHLLLWHEGFERVLLMLNGLMAGRVDPGTKYIVSGQIVQLVLAVLIPTSHKFTTSAFWMLRLTEKRFRAKMRSERKERGESTDDRLIPKEFLLAGKINL